MILITVELFPVPWLIADSVIQLQQLVIKTLLIDSHFSQPANSV